MFHPEPLQPVLMHLELWSTCGVTLILVEGKTVACLHGAELGATHGAEVSRLGGLLRQGGIVK